MFKHTYGQYKGALLLVFVLLFNACATTSYVGNRYPPTEDVDVFYSARDVKQEYETIGHLSEQVSGMGGEEKAKQNIIAKARQVGGHAVIIVGIEHVATNNSNVQDYQKAEVIRYTGKAADQ